LALRPFQELSFPQAPRHLEIDGLQRRWRREVCLLKSSLQPLVLSPEVFPFNEQGEAFVKGEVMIRGLSLLLLPGFQSADEPQRFQLL
jgi:hypothetical protein